MRESSNRPFFVYGTLLRGQPNYYVWGGAIVSEKRAKLPNGRLYDMGHYPMLVEGGAEPVWGRLVVVRQAEYAATLARLDHLEGYDPEQHEACAYRRVVREVQLTNGRVHSAWVYIGHPRYVASLTPIAGGDWAAYVATTAKKSGDWWANIKSVSGLLD